MFKLLNFVSVLSVFVAFFNVQKSISAQNQAPRFEPPLQSNYFFPEYNSTKPGDVLLWLNATDDDDSDLQFGVESDFYKKLIQVKKIDGKHAMVLANQKFDREIQDKYENIVFYVKDKPGNKVYQSVRFVILDIDDNPPIFKNTPYKINVIENQPIDTVIFEGIEAFDLDGPLHNKFSFTLSNYNDLFAIDKANYLNTGHYSTNLVLKQKLDYDKSKNYVLTINAVGENSYFKTSTELLINVIDFPDKKPGFSQSPYYVQIPEELEIGEFVLQVYAKDGDIGINNPCKYTIVENSLQANYFRIDSITGVITLSKRIDLESSDIVKLGGLLEFYVLAIEIGDENSYQQTKVTVAILDINDNNPIFNKNSYNLNISPKSSVGTSLSLIDNDIESIHVYDMDKGINGSFSLNLLKVLHQNESFVQYENSSDFEVVPKIALNDANLILKLTKPNNLLKIVGSIEHYHLFAKDNGINGKQIYVNLHIKIDNINEYAPKFNYKVYTLYVDENAPFNTTIGFIKAYDNDTFGEYGKIFYELKNSQERFQIDRLTGRVYTISDNPSVQLDRELIDTYFMSVDAIDGGGLRASAQLIVKLNDLNDNMPQFTSNLFNLKNYFTKNNTNQTNILVGYIEENTSKWLEPIKLQAFDRDTGLNGAIQYEIIEGDCFKDYFNIDNKTNSIVLKDNLTLDFEEVFNLKQKMTYQLKTIQINKEISNLVLNPGEIDLNLVILARDLGLPSLSSKIIAKIIIKDVNDNKPKFDRLFYSAQVLETASFGDVIQVNAFDQDAPNTANSKIIYSIESGNKDKFSIDSTSGIVRINENTNLDKDLYGSVYQLKIVANDFESINSKNINNKNSDENYCYLAIEIIDVNNKKPQITSNLKIINVTEDTIVGTKIGQIEAIDLDLDSKLNFFIIKNSNSFDKILAYDGQDREIDSNIVKNWFEIDSNNGTLYINSKLDRELAEIVQIVIGVEDLNASKDFKPQITKTVLKIKIIDINDNFPFFPTLKQLNSDHILVEGEEPLFELYETIDENIKLNTKITQLKALDIDKDNNITYKIIHSNDPFKSLSLNKYTGEIFVNNPVDYELIRWINLTILVNDNGSPNQKHTILHFYCRINDLNDNAPKFEPLEATEFEIYENNQLNHFITQFKAVDNDSGEFGLVNYKILNGDDDKFEINPINGKLFAKSILDREEQSLYTLVIQVRDNPNGLSSNQLTDSVTIKIRVLDRNDNRPYCEQSNYLVETAQNVDSGTVLLNVKGVDHDIHNNSKLMYLLNSNNEFDQTNSLFEINETNGQIKTKNKLIGYSGTLKYIITIKDNHGINESLSGNCTIEFRIKDVNIHIPKFIYPDLNNSIRRIKSSLPFGSYLLTINATDEDNGLNGEIAYYLDENKIRNEDWKNFNLDPKTGILTLNNKLNMNKQSVYSIDIIATDKGRPIQLSSRLTITFILVDESNNTAKFNRMDLCLSGVYQCEKNFQALIIKLKEELDPSESAVSVNYAYISDISLKDQNVCYYLIGKDKVYFNINKTTGILKPNKKLDREFKDKYELIIKASEYCFCDLNQSLDEKFQKHCAFTNTEEDSFNTNDISLIKTKIYIQDINDNSPKFIRNFYQIGITSDIDFGETILESIAYDKDVNSSLYFSILNSSMITNMKERNNYPFELPFSLEFFNTITSRSNSTNLVRESKFQIKTKQFFKEQNLLNNMDQNQNLFYQFNLSVFDENNLNDTALIQIILINKQQRVKLVFSQDIDKVVQFQDDFQNHISNLTGFRAYVDKISVHRADDFDDPNNQENLSNQQILTEMLLHFVEPNSAQNNNKTKRNSEYSIIDADTILNVLDRSKDTSLLKKYKLSLAEKYDLLGSTTFYKYGSAALEDDFGSFFQLNPTLPNSKSFLTKLFLSFLIIMFLACTLILITACICMRHKYKRKLKAERAMVKAFGLDQRSISYNDVISGYINHGFDSNSLLPIPGTNLYSYEGSNPIWLKKYDKVDINTNPSSSSSSSSTTSEPNDTSSMINDNRFRFKNKNQNHNNDISTFYLKQIDSSPSTLRSSPTSNNTDKNTIKNVTITSDVLSVKEISANFISNEPVNEAQNLSSFKSETLLTFAPSTVSSAQILNQQITNKGNEIISFKEQIKILSAQKLNKIQADKAQTIMFPNSSTNFTKIFDNYQEEKKQQDTIPSQTNAKEFNDLFAVESTVI